MADPRSGIRFFTLDEANALLPKLHQQLGLMREIRRRIVALQAKVDIEELTSPGIQPEPRRTAELLRGIDAEVQSFHRSLEAFHLMGAELKDLERGLVDFYSMRGNDVVYLCWMDGEPDIQWWHPLDTGFKDRQPL